MDEGDIFRLVARRQRLMSDADIGTASRTLFNNRCTKTLQYRGWRVTRGPIGSFQFFIEFPNGWPMGTTFLELDTALDNIERVAARIN